MQPLPLQTLAVQTTSRNEMIDVTGRVAQFARQHNISEGMVMVYVPHTTAAVTIN